MIIPNYNLYCNTGVGNVRLAGRTWHSKPCYSERHMILEVVNTRPFFHEVRYVLFLQ
jgi:hypothetical protein